jgi:hypothetical protein
MVILVVEEHDFAAYYGSMMDLFSVEKESKKRRMLYRVTILTPNLFHHKFNLYINEFSNYFFAKFQGRFSI